MVSVASCISSLSVPVASLVTTTRYCRSQASIDVMATQLFVETPVETTVSTPSARSELSSAVERNAPCVVLLSTRSPGPGFSASTTSCSGWPAMLLVALMIGAMWWGASLASAALAP